ncbi:MAG: hypothetical protein ABIP96_04525 [Patescibacteria group bacterium]
MEDQINGRGLGTHGVDALGVTCSEIDVLTFEEFEELYPKLVPPKRKLFNKKRKARSPKLQASLAKKRNAPRSP